MKTGKSFLLGCLIFPVFLVIMFFIGFCSTMGDMGGGKLLTSDSWLVIDPNGMISDYNEFNSSFLGMSQNSADDIIRKISQAAKDKRVSGILIKAGAFDANYANLAEIGAAITEFRKSGKPVVAHGDFITQKAYYLSSFADSIYMEASASAGLMLEGAAANVLFYKEALQKLGVKMHVMQAGEFKGAGEPYTQTELSPGTRENLMKVLKARYELLISDIARARGIDSTIVADIFGKRDNFVIKASEAQSMGLIDHLASYDDVLDRYGISPDNSVSIGQYKQRGSSTRAERVAVLYLSGSIGPDVGFGSTGTISAAKVQKALDAIEKDSGVKALVVRVNSPGGGALESEIIYQKLKRLQQKMPVVISMGGVAASGGYYIACSGSHIIADPYTVTGSIGVIMALPETTELGRKLGVRGQTLRYGKYAGSFNLFEPYSPEFLASLKSNSAGIYAEFRQRVSDARGIAPEDMDAVAEGRVFSASDALQMGLIDEIGSLNTAVVKAAEMAGIRDYSVQRYPNPLNFWQAISESGAFKTTLSALISRPMNAEEQMEYFLRKTFKTDQWLYACPYKLD